MKDFLLESLFPQKPAEILLDNAAGKRKLLCAIEAETSYAFGGSTNIGRGTYRSARVTEAAVEESRNAVKSFLNAGAEYDLVFTHGTTAGLNLLARCCTGAFLKQGANVITTVAEHHSNLLPWMRACEETGATLRIAKPSVRLDSRGNVEVTFPAEAVCNLMDANTAIVSLTGCSNVTGTLLPIAQIVKSAHSMGIPVIVDAAQLSAHQRVQLDAIGCDAICIGGHKLYGPTGLGAICATKAFLDRLPNDDLGGGMVEEINLEENTFRLKSGHARFEAGTLPIGQILGFGAAVDCLGKLGMENIQRREDHLRRYLLKHLSRTESYRHITGGNEAAPIVSLVSDVITSLDLAAMCDAHGIAVRAGKHCAHPFLDFLGEFSTLRVSPCFYNTEAEIDSFIDLLLSLERRFRR